MSNTGINIRNIDIINLFQLYTTGQKQQIGIITNGNVDIGTILQPYSSGRKTLVGIYININVDIGTLFQSSVYVSGLSVKIYSGDFVDNVRYDTGKTPTYSGSGITNCTNVNTITNGQISLSGATNFTVVLSGIFIPDFTGLWTFGSASDDASYMWIGINATSRYTITNADLSNNWQFGTTTKTVSLISGQVYPFRIIYGQGGGPYGFTFFYSRNGSENSSNFSGKFFYI
jgi:hypothetical protein